MCRDGNRIYLHFGINDMALIGRLSCPAVQAAHRSQSAPAQSSARVSSLWVQNLGVLRDALANLAGLRKKQCRIYWMTAPLQLPRMDAFYRAKRPNPKAPPMPQGYCPVDCGHDWRPPRKPVARPCNAMFQNTWTRVQWVNSVVHQTFDQHPELLKIINYDWLVGPLAVSWMKASNDGTHWESKEFGDVGCAAERMRPLGGQSMANILLNSFLTCPRA